MCRCFHAQWALVKGFVCCSEAILHRCLLLFCSLVVTTICLADDVSSGKTKRNSGSELWVGAAQREITPPVGFPMSGYFHERLATETRDPLFAKAFVLEQGDLQLVWVACDLVGVTRDLYEEVSQESESKHGIPIKHHLISATHSHTAPDYRAHLVKFLQGELAEADGSYAKSLVRQMVGVIGDAIKNRKRATVVAGIAEQGVSVSFNRRSVMQDGSIQTWQRESNPKRLRAAGPIDDELGIVIAKDASDGQPFAVCSSFALHLDTVGGTRWSADYPSVMQRAVEQECGAEVISLFGTGTCGDINHVDPSRSERNSTEFIGNALSKTLIEKSKELLTKSIDASAAPTQQLKYRHSVVPLPLRSISKSEVERAQALVPRARAGEKVAFEDLVAANRTVQLDQLLHQTSWIEPSHPANVAPMVAWKGVGDHLPVEVATITLGQELALVFLPGEVFVDLGLAIKRHSPFRNTLVIELTNCSEPAYLPTHAAFAQGSYEVINSRTQPGAGEKLVAAALSLLRSAASDPAVARFENLSE